MGGKPSRRNSAPQPGCIFCGATETAKGQFWPSWALRAAKVKAADAPPVALCKTCGSDRTAALDAKVQKIAVPLIRGDDAILTPDMQTILVQWIMAKIMIHAQGGGTAGLIPQDEQDAFKQDGVIPSGITIWIARSPAAKWRNASATPSARLAAPGAVPANGGRNAMTVALGLGALFVYALVNRAENIALDDFIMLRDPAMRLWPLTEGDLTWPTRTSLSEAEADAIAMSLPTLVSHPNARLTATV